MMDYRTNVRSVLETCFAGFKDELIEAATDRICSIKMKKNPLYMVKADGSIEPLQKKGKWIADVDRWGDIVTTVNGYKCSLCCCFNADTDNFCPNCGAKMEGEKE